MLTAGPLLILFLPVLAGALAYLLRGLRSIPSFIGAGVSLALGLTLLLLPSGQVITIGGQTIDLEQPVAVLGRSLVMEPSDRLALSFLFLTSAGIFLLAWRFDRGQLIVPIGLGLLGLLGGVLLIQPLIYAALMLQIAAAFSIFPLHAEEETSARGGLRYLIFYTLALPGLLISHWLLEQYAVSPDRTSFLQIATGLIALSFALMLGLVPFHTWVPAIGKDGAPLMAAFQYSTIAGAVWFLLLDYLQVTPWLNHYPQWGGALFTIGAITAVVGGLLGTTRRSPGTLMGYMVMVDMGMIVVALGQGTQRGLGVAMALLLARAVGTTLMAAGLGGLRRHSRAGTHLPDGIGWQAPWSTLAVLVGGLSLAGLPPTAGFAVRWALISTVLSADPVLGIILLLASIGPALGLVRLMYGLLHRSQPVLPLEEEEKKEEVPPVEPTPVADIVLLTILSAATILLGLFPQLLALAANSLASYFPFFTP